MTVHDHFDGSSHCVECGGICRLQGADRHVTEFIRGALEHFALTGWSKPPSGLLGSSFDDLVGKDRAKELWKSAQRSAAELQKVMGSQGSPESSTSTGTSTPLKESSIDQ